MMKKSKERPDKVLKRPVKVMMTKEDLKERKKLNFQKELEEYRKKNPKEDKKEESAKEVREEKLKEREVREVSPEKIDEMIVKYENANLVEKKESFNEVTETFLSVEQAEKLMKSSIGSEVEKRAKEKYLEVLKREDNHEKEAKLRKEYGL